MSNKNSIYIFSGLGADKRVFQTMDFSDFDVHHIEWIKPLEKESMADYAFRISNDIIPANAILMGFSFGGMVAMEIAKQIEVKKLILIATAKSKWEVPAYFRMAGFLKLPQIIPISWLKYMRVILYWFFGLKTKEEKQLLNQIIDDSDDDLLRWALGQIANRCNMEIPKNAIHIHGTSDRIFPIRNVKCDYKILNGGHFMTIQKPTEVMEIIKEIVN